MCVGMIVQTTEEHGRGHRYSNYSAESMSEEHDALIDTLTEEHGRSNRYSN